MANHKSAIKRAKQNEKRRLRNRALRSNYRTQLKNFRNLISAKSFEDAQSGLPGIYKTIDRAVTKGIIHKNEAARRKSRLTLALAKAQAA